MITPSTSLQEIKSDDKQDQALDLPIPDNFLYRSCCFLIDKRFAEFIVKLSLIFAVIGFSLYKLNTLDDCEKQQPYMGLLTLLIGLVFPKNRLRSGG